MTNLWALTRSIDHLAQTRMKRSAIAMMQRSHLERQKSAKTRIPTKITVRTIPLRIAFQYLKIRSNCTKKDGIRTRTSWIRRKTSPRPMVRTSSICSKMTRYRPTRRRKTRPTPRRDQAAQKIPKTTQRYK